MDIPTGLLIAISLGLLGVFFSIRASVHSLQLSRRQARWPERRRQMVNSRRYFGLALILTVMILAGVVITYTVNITHPVLRSTPSASPEWTATNVPSKTQTNTPVVTSTPAPTDTPTLTSTPAPTDTITPVPSQPPWPTDTRWPTWTPSLTPTVTLTPPPSRTPTATATMLPTWTPIPTDTRWPVLTPTGIQ